MNNYRIYYQQGNWWASLYHLNTYMVHTTVASIFPIMELSPVVSCSISHKQWTQVWTTASKYQVLSTIHRSFPGGLVVKGSPANAGVPRDASSIPGSGRSPGEGNGNPLQCFAWRIPWTEEPGGATAHEAAKSWTRLSPPHRLCCSLLLKEGVFWPNMSHALLCPWMCWEPWDTKLK